MEETEAGPVEEDDTFPVDAFPVEEDEEDEEARAVLEESLDGPLDEEEEEEAKHSGSFPTLHGFSSSVCG